MGIAVAKAAMLRGADVTLVSGKTEVPVPMFVNSVKITTAQDMFEKVSSISDEYDIIVKTAAVADFTPEVISEEKIKKSGNDLDIHLIRTPDTLKWLGEHKHKGQILCGFAMETQNALENGRAKLIKKNIDLIAVNSLRDPGAGFSVDTNRLTLISRNETVPLDLMSKDMAAHMILDHIIKLTRE